MTFSPLDMLAGPMMGGGLSGGDAAPSFAQSSVQGNPYFYAPFSVAGSGGTSNATASPNTGGSQNFILLAAFALAGLALFVGLKK